MVADNERAGNVSIRVGISQGMERPMEKWNADLVAGNETLGNVSIRGSIFQGDVLSPLLFILTLILPTTVLREIKTGYKFGSGIIHKPCSFLDDLKNDM